MKLWQALNEELERSPQPVNLWWRDDDATSATPALEELLSIQSEFAVPLYLAVIPASTTLSLPARIHELENVWVLQHGYDHQSHAKPEQRKIELGGTQQEESLKAKLTEGKNLLERTFQQQFLPVMVPPWNRLDGWVGNYCLTWGYKLLSTLGTLKPPPECIQPNTSIPDFPVHIDIMDWQNRCYAGDEVVIANIIRHIQYQREQSNKPPTLGLMTHHLVHDTACNDFLRRFFDYCRQQGKIQYGHSPRQFPGGL